VKNIRFALAAFFFLVAALPGSPAHGAEDLSGAHDFDFELGDWTVHHRVKRPSGE
jgi:hypothetical protein